jgi:hypothetical protein
MKKRKSLQPMDNHGLSLHKKRPVVYKATGRNYEIILYFFAVLLTE